MWVLLFFFLNKFIKTSFARTVKISDNGEPFWKKEILGYQVDEIAATLRMSSRTIEQYV